MCKAVMLIKELQTEMMLSCESITAFGSPVVPEVYLKRCKFWKM